MSEILSFAKETLIKENLTCVIADGNEIYKSNKRGVLPLIEWYDKGLSFKGFSAADKVVGRAAAFLYVLLGVDELYAGVVSRSALEVFRDNNVKVSFGEVVDYIKNRTNTGYCPMEQATLNVVLPKDAVDAIKNKMIELNNK